MRNRYYIFGQSFRRNVRKVQILFLKMREFTIQKQFIESAVTLHLSNLTPIKINNY